MTMTIPMENMAVAVIHSNVRDDKYSGDSYGMCGDVVKEAIGGEVHDNAPGNEHGNGSCIEKKLYTSGDVVALMSSGNGQILYMIATIIMRPP